MEASSGFTWRDGPRTIVFGDGVLARAPELLTEHGVRKYDLLTTRRAKGDAPKELAEGAEKTHTVVRGPVPDAAAKIIDEVESKKLVALGGGRVVDVAKAIASVRGGEVVAIPTTLAGSPMTGFHKLPAGRESDFKGFVRPTFVIADPMPMTSSPEEQLRATAMNALAHGAESLYAPGANPVAEMAALRGAELIATALDRNRGTRDRPALALGAILGAYAIDATGLALHHALCQTLVKVMRLPHAEVNATMLPHTMTAMSHRASRQISQLAGALGASAGAIGARISELGGGTRRLSDLGANRKKIDEVLDEIEARGDTAANTPNAPDREEIRAIIEAAW